MPDAVCWFWSLQLVPPRSLPEGGSVGAEVEAGERDSGPPLAPECEGMAMCGFGAHERVKRRFGDDGPLVD